MSRRGNIRSNLDWPVIILAGILMLAGWLNIYAAGYDEAQSSIFDMGKESGKQFLWIVVAAFIIAITLVIEGEFFQRFSWGFYGISVLSLILVLFIGTEINGARAWFKFGSFSIQPAEFAKLATALALAKYISGQKVRFRKVSTRVQATLIIALPAILILRQPDTGTVLVFMAFIFAMYREGLSGNILIVGFAALVLAVISTLLSYTVIDYPFYGSSTGIPVLVMVICGLGLIVFLLIKVFILPRNRKPVYLALALSIVGSAIFVTSIGLVMDKALKAHHKKRIEILLGLDDDPQGAGYNVKQSKTAIGSGGFTGKGFLKGPFTKYGFVPEQSTDFIFCTVGEEWGFLGSSAILILYVILMLRLLFIAERQRSQYARIYGYCVASILFFHVLINVGMVIGLAPVIGIPLPFLSYGGSSMMGFALMLSILLRFDAERLSVLR